MSLDDEFVQSDRSPLSEAEFRSRLQLLAYLWIEKEIPLWRPDLSRKYLQASQSLLAAIPEGDQHPAGLAYFKSVFDPLWTSDDISLLQQSAYPWILLILSPCERFYEFDAALADLAAQSGRIMIWRPAVPAHNEMDRLHQLAQDSSVFAEDGTLQQSPGHGKMEEICALLADLYVKRGLLMHEATRLDLGREAEGIGLRRCLALHLIEITRQTERVSAPREGAYQPLAAVDNEGEIGARRWAELLTDAHEFREMELSAATNQLLAWWDKSPAGKMAGFVGQLSQLPETFMTTRFSRELTTIRSRHTILKGLMERLSTGDDSFTNTMSQIAHHFGREESHLLAWKNSMAELAALTSWLPMLIHAQDYLRSAYPLGQPEIDELRQSLLEMLDEPHRLLESGQRQHFDRNFLEFKKIYAACYASAHEDALNIRGKSGPDNPALDKEALRDLEILASLEQMDQSYLNRVRLVAKWIQSNQCELPVREILERYPRCYCNFNPVSYRHMAGAAAPINILVAEGIEYYRTVLRQCRSLIMEELAGTEADALDRAELTSLLSQDPLVHLRFDVARMLNPAIRKHTKEFSLAVRKAGRKTAKPSAC